MNIVYNVDESFECISINDRFEDCLDSEKNEYMMNSPIERWHTIIRFKRKFPKLAFVDWKEPKFNGFTVKWNYSYSTQSFPFLTKYREKKYNKYFVQIANLVHRLSSLSKAELMNKVKKIKAKDSNVDSIIYPRFWGDTQEEVYDEIFYDIALDLGSMHYTVSSKDHRLVFDTFLPLYEKEISDETLETSAEIIFYIFVQQEKYWEEWYIKYRDWFIQTPLSLRRMLSK